MAFVSLALCSLVALVLAVSGGQLPELGNGPSWTPPASVDQAQQPARGATTGLSEGDLVVNASASRVRLRRTPGYQNKPADDILLSVSSGTQGVIVGGPVGADGLQWWLVRFGGQEGWMAERTSQGLLLLDRAN